jgi:hypothetical protein
MKDQKHPPFDYKNEESQILQERLPFEERKNIENHKRGNRMVEIHTKTEAEEKQ